MTEPTRPLWQIEIRHGGKPVTTIEEARRILEVLNLVPDDTAATEAEIDTGGRIEPEDPENGIWLAEIPARYDEDLERGEEWYWHEPLESGDEYEVWLPQP